MEESEFNIRSIIGLLRRRLRLIIVTLVAVLVLAGIVTIALTPLFTASTLIFIDTARKNLLDPDMQNTSAASDNARVDSEVEILRSDTILIDVIDRLGLIMDPEFGVKLGLRDNVLAFLRLGEGQLPSGEAAVQSVLGKLRSATTIQRRGLTYLISVQVRSESPDRAAALADAIAEAYIGAQLRAKVEGVMAASQILEARVTQARANVLESEERFDAFISDNIDQLAAQPGSSVAMLRSSLDSLTTEREALQNRVVAGGAALRQRDWAEVVSTLQSDALAELERQREATAAALSAADAGSPAAVNLREELATIERSLEQQADRDIRSIRAEVAELDEEVGGMRQRMRSDLLASDLPLDVLTGLFELQQSADLARAQLQTLLARGSDLRVQAELQLSDSRIVSRAMPPAQPSFPNTRLILLLAGLGGLGLGIGLAFVYENFVGGFLSDTQLATVTRKPSLGEVPLQKLPADTVSAAKLMVDAPLSRYAESIRRIRAGIDLHLSEGRESGQMRASRAGSGKVVMVTSSVSGEGKTTIALSLARAYAVSGKKTLIIDCDLRRPSVHKHLSFDPNVGLLEYLAGRSEPKSLGSLIMRDDQTGLSVLVGSRRSDIPTDQLVTGVTFGNLIEAATSNFDIIILDTPPVLPVVDAIYLARHADAVLFIAKWSSTAQSEVRSALERLGGSMRNPPILTVLNQQAETRAGYGRAYGGYYEG
ncbi:polysaccharide biosynthesis tyrosine autokinase [Pelagibacterium limicola]|uniref:polysaccharide biosynthesis tyrosine autokinase n=1 Tax=Pelagibacterium limicola TaxID=2791022 RepID=UPI0018AFF4BB|nr:polysaccharide biosynthesis tyrosine autokinase [Pelagibacterium limicola]